MGTPYNSTEAHSVFVQLTAATRPKLQELIDDKKKLIETNYNLKVAIKEQAKKNRLDPEESWIDIKSEEFVREPREGMIHLCNVLDLECTEDYIDACVSIVMSSPSTPRRSINWPQDMIRDMEEWFQKIDWLRGYSFNGM
jgi:hypothetical protein